jgi:hypothetical protein
LTRFFLFNSSKIKRVATHVRASFSPALHKGENIYSNKEIDKNIHDIFTAPCDMRICIFSMLSRINECVWQHSHLPLYLFSLLPKKSNPKHYFFSNKKTHYKTKLFHFPIKQFQTFLYIISYQLLFTTIQTKIPQHNYLPNTPNVTNK